MRTLHISAGGKGERISSYIHSQGNSYPKHLLPIPTPSRTILGEIVDKSSVFFESVKVWSSESNYPSICSGIDSNRTHAVEIDDDMTGPLGPMVRNLLSSHERTFGCAGDFFCNFSWNDFLVFHEGHSLPVSILIANSVPTKKGATFNAQNGKVTSWNRVDQTTTDDLINIGCYIIDPDDMVIQKLKSLKEHKEDLFFDSLIPTGFIAGYNPGNIGFNINIADVYEKLLATFH